LRFIENRFSLKGTTRIVVLLLLLGAALNGNSTAGAARVAVVVVPPFELATYAHRGAVGLLVPGAGATVSRTGALASLERGRVTPALLGGVPGGPVLVRPATKPGSQVTLYVALPPPGRSANDRRYPVAVVGCGARGELTSSTTRLNGLVFISDIAAAAVRLRAGGCRASPLGWRPDADAVADLRALDRRLTHVHPARGGAFVAVLISVGLLGLLGRPAVLGCIVAVVASFILAAAGVEGHWTVILGVGGTVLACALALALPLRRVVPLAVVAFLVAFLCVLLVDTRLNSLAVLGARPEGGDRFYGVTNQLETLLLAPTIVAAAAGGLAWLAGVGALALVTIGWSKTGADGGGLVVYATALAVIALHLRGIRFGARSLVAATGAVAALVLAFVGLDAALGGSSHVTHAFGTGLGSMLGDLGRRLHLSYLSVTSSWSHGVEFLVSVGILVAIAAWSRRSPLVRAFVAAIVVSFVVNDTPLDIAFLGALGCWALARWDSVDSRAMRRPAVLFTSMLLVLAAAGCGSQGTVRALPKTVVGTIKLAAPGKGIFTSNGCNGCHTYKPAAATGKIGPDLDKLSQYARQAKQPLNAFVKTSIVNPNAYVQPGFPKGVMPSFKQLSQSDVNDLVQFLTKPQG
jgi:cytochrome c551/c552